jgi:aerobic-type carbon monoxide dehydrogenase small subunit (CoxS/CutS family)
MGLANGFPAYGDKVRLRRRFLRRLHRPRDHALQFPVRASKTRARHIEGLSTKDGQLHPLQAAFAQHDALQCGFCTSGMILRAHGLLLKNPNPTREEIIAGLDENLCRCGAHIRIIQAVQTAAQNMKGGQRR